MGTSQSGSKGRGRMLGEAHGGTRYSSCFLVHMTVTWVMCVICWDSPERHPLKTAEIMKTNVWPYRNQAHPGPGRPLTKGSPWKRVWKVGPSFTGHGGTSPGWHPVRLTALWVLRGTEETSTGKYVLKAQSPRPAFPLQIKQEAETRKGHCLRTHRMDPQVHFSDIKPVSFPITLTSKV